MAANRILETAVRYATTNPTRDSRHFGAGVVRRPKGSPKPTPPPDLCGLVLIVRGTSYRVIRITPQDPEVLKAFRLRKPDGSTYTVHVDQHGPHCTCGDGVFRKEGTADSCKHVRAMRAWGLLP